MRRSAYLILVGLAVLVALPLVHADDPRTTVSNGSEWFFCGNTTNDTAPQVVAGQPVTGATAIAPILTSNSSGLSCLNPPNTAQCSADKNECNRACFDLYEDAPDCVAQCDSNYLLCKQIAACADAIGTTCNDLTTKCDCSDAQRWNATSSQCEDACPSGYTYDSTVTDGKYCTKNGVVGSQPSTTSTLTEKAVCTVIGAYTCNAVSWNETNNGPFYLKSLGGTPEMFTNATSDIATHVCKGGIPVKVTMKPSPDFRKPGPCSAEQCYTGNDDSATMCIPIGTWIGDNYCDNASNVGVWTTRTRMLADTLLSNIDTDYVLHCDASAKSLNTPVAALAPATSTFCVLTTIAADNSTTTKLIGAPVGTNSLYERTIDPTSSQIAKNYINVLSVKNFITTIKNALLNVTLDNCTILVGSTDNSFQPCDTTNSGDRDPQGSVLYQTKENLIVMTPTVGVDSITTRSTSIAAQLGLDTTASTTQIYSAQHGNRKIDAIITRIGPVGTKSGTLLTARYENITISNYYAKRPNPKSSDKCDPPGNVQKVIIANATPSQWNYFTLAIRP